MAYSFIERRKKPLWPKGLERLWIGTAVVLALTGVSVLFFRFDAQTVAAQIERRQAEKATLAAQLEQLGVSIASMKEVAEFSRKIATGNELLADQWGDLLDLVPDDTVLERFKWRKDGFVMQGTTSDVKRLEQRFATALSGRYRLASSRASHGRFTMTFRAAKERS